MPLGEIYTYKLFLDPLGWSTLIRGYAADDFFAGQSYSAKILLSTVSSWSHLQSWFKALGLDCQSLNIQLHTSREDVQVPFIAILKHYPRKNASAKGCGHYWCRAWCTLFSKLKMFSNFF